MVRKGEEPKKTVHTNKKELPKMKVE